MQTPLTIALLALSLTTPLLSHPLDAASDLTKRGRGGYNRDIAFAPKVDVLTKRTELPEPEPHSRGNLKRTELPEEEPHSRGNLKRSELPEEEPHSRGNFKRSELPEEEPHSRGNLKRSELPEEEPHSRGNLKRDGRGGYCKRALDGTSAEELEKREKAGCAKGDWVDDGDEEELGKRGRGGYS